MIDQDPLLQTCNKARPGVVATCVAIRVRLWTLGEHHCAFKVQGDRSYIE